MSVSDIEIIATSGPTTPRPASRLSSSLQSRLNKRLSFALIALLAIAPLPFGSVHGFVWGLWSAYIGVCALLYFVALALSGETLRVPLRNIWLSAGLFILFLAWLGVQLLPIGDLLGTFTIARSGDVALTSETISVASSQTILMLARQLTYGLFFFLMLQVSFNGNRSRTILDAIVAISLVYAMVGIVSLQSGDTILGLTKVAYLGSATGPFVNRNSFATFLAMGSVVTLAQLGNQLLFAQGTRHLRRHLFMGGGSVAIYGAVYVILFGVVVATQSRMGLAVTLLGAAIVGFSLMTRLSKRAVSTAVVAAVLLVAMGAGLVLFGLPLLDRLFDLRSSIGFRIDLYKQIIELISIRTLTGFGGGAFELAYPLVHELPVNLGFFWDKGHNTYLTLAAELGVVAATGIVLIYLALASRMVWGLLTGNGSWVGQTAGVAAIVLTAAHSLVDFSLEIPANTFVLLAIVAIGTSSTLRTRSTSDTANG